MEITWGDEKRVTSIGEVVTAFYEAALEDDTIWSHEEAWALTKIALRDFFKRHLVSDSEGNMQGKFRGQQ